jgi:hypothetical protein
LKKVLIIYPHFPPSNLAGVHRPRLFAQHLPDFGWEPVILTVDEKYYEEPLDWNLRKLLPASLRIEKVNAFKITRPRLMGDIGLRGFFQLYKRAKQLIKTEHFDFVYILIPSFYCALLGRMLNRSTGIKYGIDYIDPWVHDFPRSDRIFSRAWFSKKMAAFLEPLAVKKASLITGVAEGYYAGVLERNPHLKKTTITGAMPYGGEEQDYVFLKQMELKPYLFEKKENKIQLVYAGAMLPKAYLPLESAFKSIAANKEIFENVEFHFIGTGSRANDDKSYNIKRLAESYGLWQTNIFEYPKRIPYLDVLIHLQNAHGIFILGSTEPHYTPSKVYQAVLAEKPVLAVLHKDSTAVKVIKESQAGIVLEFNGENGIPMISNEFCNMTCKFIESVGKFKIQKTNICEFERFSANSMTFELVKCLEKVVE